MTKIISFISRKGGIGKTTSAINLATVMYSLGHKLTLIETDTNYTLSTLRSMELFHSKAKDNAIFKILGSTPDTIMDDLAKVQEQTALDYILVDSAGKTTDEEIKRLAVASHAIIVPTSLTQNDTLVTYQTIQDLKPAKELNEGLQILVLPNRIHSSTRPTTIHKALESLDAHILEKMVPQKNIYANFSTIMPEKGYLPIAEEILSLLSTDNGTPTGEHKE